jgi:hypothetical protein
MKAFEITAKGNHLPYLHRKRPFHDNILLPLAFARVIKAISKKRRVRVIERKSNRLRFIDGLCQADNLESGGRSANISDFALLHNWVRLSDATLVHF